MLYTVYSIPARIGGRGVGNWEGDQPNFGWGGVVFGPPVVVNMIKTLVLSNLFTDIGVTTASNFFKTLDEHTVC